MEDRLGRGDVELHFIADSSADALATASSCRLYVDDAQALFAEWRQLVPPDDATGRRIIEPTPTDYGMREFAVVDGSGNLVRIGTSSLLAREGSAAGR